MELCVHRAVDSPGLEARVVVAKSRHHEGVDAVDFGAGMSRMGGLDQQERLHSAPLAGLSHLYKCKPAPPNANIYLNLSGMYYKLCGFSSFSLDAIGKKRHRGVRCVLTKLPATDVHATGLAYKGRLTRIRWYFLI